MKSKITTLAVLLLVAPVLFATTGLRPVMIRITQLPGAGEKEVTAAVVIVSETKVARLRIDAVAGPALDLSVSPRVEGNQVTLTLRSFAPDLTGQEAVTELPAVVTKLDQPVEIHVGMLGLRLLVSLEGPPPQQP
jgi:hypothetical protein